MIAGWGSRIGRWHCVSWLSTEPMTGFGIPTGITADRLSWNVSV
ncbi:hypothetical protein C8E87_8186 [Paractinoplanes brasiliensis]|uniref:Uncharacterized protein n=1 Tax=Paractinoplanes brasiliensis TaxID=52695 RepID=A0A4R6JAK4_9ACTN|nr:hypothetical protein C8E87_8186 [Actinoplanes brasiliensis]